MGTPEAVQGQNSQALDGHLNRHYQLRVRASSPTFLNANKMISAYEWGLCISPLVLLREDHDRPLLTPPTDHVIRLQHRFAYWSVSRY